AAAAIFVLAFSFGAQAGLVAPRYMFPIVVLVVPWAARALERRPLLVGLVLAGRLVWFAGGLTSDPPGLHRAPEAWHRASAWPSGELRPGERFAIPYHSFYSTWDVPRPDTDPRWSYSFRTPEATMRRQLDEAGIDKLLVDLEDEDLPTYRDRVGETFLGWPRCFAAERFLVYCRPTRAPRPSPSRGRGRARRGRRASRPAAAPGCTTPSPGAAPCPRPGSGTTASTTPGR